MQHDPKPQGTAILIVKKPKPKDTTGPQVKKGKKK